MTWDDFIYALLLLISIFGALLSNGCRPSHRAYFMSLFGLAIAVCVCGTFIWHSLAVCLLSISLICIRVKNFHIIVFVVGFGYLIFFRTCHLMGFDKPPSYSNAIQLILTLKLVGVAFEISDSLERARRWKKLQSDGSVALDSAEMEQLRLEMKYCSVEADFCNLFMYSYCFIGLLTGPYYKFRVYIDCMRFHHDARHLDQWKQQMRNKLAAAASIGIAYLVSSHFFYIEYAKTDHFYERSFIYRFCFMAVMFFVFRMRMYFAWLISESVCMCAGMGAYPLVSAPMPGQGPTDLRAMEDERQPWGDISYETTRNLSIAGCEWAPTVREGMRSWNMSVQYWLVTFVYRRFPVRKFRTAVTMLVSAFWHGVHPGYYLSFMTIPLALQAEAALEHLLRVSPSEKLTEHQWVPQILLQKSFFIRWFYKMRVFDYCCMGFLLLEFNSTVYYWWSIGLSVHLAMVALISIGIYARSRDTQPSRRPQRS